MRALYFPSVFDVLLLVSFFNLAKYITGCRSCSALKRLLSMLASSAKQLVQVVLSVVLLPQPKQTPVFSASVRPLVG